VIQEAFPLPNRSIPIPNSSQNKGGGNGAIEKRAAAVVDEIFVFVVLIAPSKRNLIMFGANSGERVGDNGGQDEERRRFNHGTRTTPAQMIQVAQTTRSRPIHIPPRQMNETPDETEPSYSYEEKNCFLAFDKEEEVVDAFHRRLAASSSSSGHNGGRTGRGGSFGASSFSNTANSNNHSAGSSTVSPSLLTRNLSNTQDEGSGIFGGSSGGSNFWRTTSRRPGSSSNTRSVGKNGATSDGNIKNSQTHLSNKNHSNIKSRNSDGLARGRRRLRSSGQSAKQIHVDNNRGKEEYDEGSYNNRVKSKDTNQKQSSGELSGASRKLTREAGNNINKGQHQKASSVPLHQQQHSTQRFPHSNSASSLGSTGSANNSEARMKSKQRDEARRLKRDAQQQLGEDGGIVDNGYYHEVPTIGMELNSSNRNSTSNSMRGSIEYNTTMGALEEDISGEMYATDDSNHDPTDNVADKYGSYTFSHSNLEISTNNQINHGGGNSTTPNGNVVSNSIPTSTLLASAAGAAAAALSEYHHSNNKNSGDNTTSSLTQHIHNIRQPSASSQQQIPVVPIHLNDNTDNRSTTSTMSDLSMTDSNTNHRHQKLSSPTSGNRNSITSLNSLLNGKPVPVDSPTLSSTKNAHVQQQALSQQQQQLYRQNQNSLQQHQRFPNAAGSGDGVSGVTPAIASVIGGNEGSIGAIGIEHSRDISNNVAIPSDEIQIAPANQSRNTGNSTMGTKSTATSVTATTIGTNKGRRLQTPEFNRHNAGRNIDNANNTRRSSTDNSLLANKIALLLDACETIRFPFKKKLMLNSLHMTAADIPVKDLYGTVLGQSLYKLSLSGNRLSTIPRKLVTCLPSLKSMDISQCELHQLPERWNLPQLRRLNLSHNRLSDFPEEVRFKRSESRFAM
jgi:hypothetical protein